MTIDRLQAQLDTAITNIICEGVWVLKNEISKHGISLTKEDENKLIDYLAGRVHAVLEP